MFTDSNLKIVRDDDQYITADGTQYPPDYPKDEIPGLFPVQETPLVTPSGKVMTGFHISPDHVQVWEFRDMTPEELAAQMPTEPEPVNPPPIPSRAVLQSPNGTPFIVMVDDDGNLETQPLEEMEDATP